MIFNNGIINLKDKNIEVKSIEFIGDVINNDEELILSDFCNFKLILNDNNDFVKLVDLETFNF